MERNKFFEGCIGVAIVLLFIALVAL